MTTDPLPSSNPPALEQGAAIADLSDWGLLRFTGPDRLKFLHGLVTNDILNLPVGKGCLACVLTPKGKLVGDFAVYNRGEDILALGFARPVAAAEAVLRKNAVLSRTTVENAGGRGGLWLFVGTKMPEALAGVLGASPASSGSLEPWECRSVRCEDAEVWILSYPRFAVPAWLVLVPENRKEASSRRVAGTGKPQGPRVLGGAEFESLRIAAGIPVIGVDTDADAFPAEANLDSAINYDKGCYLGQEITSRIKNLGQVHRVLAALRLEARAEPGAEVRSGGRTIGRITSVAAAEFGSGRLALALVQRAELRPDSAFEVAGPGGPIPARVLRVFGETAS